MTEYILDSIKTPPPLHNFPFPNPKPIPSSNKSYYKFLDFALYEINGDTISSEKINYQFQQMIQDVYKHNDNLIIILETEIVIFNKGNKKERKEFDTILGSYHKSNKIFIRTSTKLIEYNIVLSDISIRENFPFY